MKNIFVWILFVFVSYTYAKDTKIEIQEIPVTANPLQINSNDMAKPVRIIGNKKLMQNSSASLGKNLKNIPGVSNSAWGENVGRPVIRGMDGNRIKILNNGLEVNDVSAMSGDHPVGIDALSADQKENKVRGNKLEKYPLQKLPKYLQNNLEKYKEWID